jgi:TetR/AcrR family transcriptional regulator, transcriptional repressor of aconitase
MQPKYSLQGSAHRRTEEAILEGTKSLIARSGISGLSMIEIADHSEVSRATLYNHYRDKDAVLAALVSSEINRLAELAIKAGTPADALESLSISISADPALAAMRIHDAEVLVKAMTNTSSEHYITIAQIIYGATKSQAGTGIAMRWLLGQVMQPITAEQSRDQALLLVENTLF